MKSQGFGSHFAISPGVATMPAAMVLPMAAAIPNQTPRTLSNPPVLRGEMALASCWSVTRRSSVLGMKSALASGHHNRGSWNCKLEVAKATICEVKLRAKELLARRAHKIPFAPRERFVDGRKMCARKLRDHLWLAQPLFIRVTFVFNHDGEGVEL